jgi:hypothetical protein
MGTREHNSQCEDFDSSCLETTESDEIDPSTVRYFLRDANVEAVLTNALCARILHLKKNPKNSCMQGLDDTLSCILKMTEQDFAEAFSIDLPRTLSAHNKKILQRKSGGNTTYDDMMENGKFVPAAAFGDQSHFHKGLEIIGLPSPKIEGAMYNDFKHQDDSRTEFEAWNSGKNVTHPSKEWDFVVEPFETASVSRDKSPQDWRPKCPYGGGRKPIRLQVFLHALSVKCSAHDIGSKENGKDVVQYGDFKTAYQREISDPLWLHDEEVATVKVIILRFIKSQLDSVSLQRAFSAKGLLIKDSKAHKLANTIITVLSTAFHEENNASFDSVCTHLNGEIGSDGVEALVDYFHAKFAHERFSRPEVIAVRLYTGPPYVKLNASLRAASGAFDKSLSEHLKGNNYVNTIYAAASGLRKLSFVTSIPKTRKVYRGMAGYKLPSKFEHAREGGGRGGVEFAFMSTTTKLEVAVSYIPDGKALPMLFEFEVGDVDRGSSISFISQYPGEEEILISPLSYLEIVGDPWVQQTVKGAVKVYPARINCNLKSRTVEEIEARRKVDFMAMKPYLLHDLRHSLDELSTALKADGLLEDDGVEQKELGTEFVLPDYHGVNNYGVELWYTSPPLQPEISSLEKRPPQEIVAIKLSCLWQDQGWGNQKGRIVARCAGSESWAEFTIDCAPHQEEKLLAKIPWRMFDRRRSSPLRIEIGYHVGGGGGHELFVRDARVTVEWLHKAMSHEQFLLSEIERFNDKWKEFELILPKQYNEDDRYKELMSSAIDFRLQSIQRLLAPLIGDVYPIHAMVQRGHLKALQCLLQMGLSSDHLDEEGCTSLMRASQMGQIEAVELLLQAGASAALTDKDQNTSCMIAICNDKIEVADILVSPTKEAGALDQQDICVSVMLLGLFN